MYSCEEEIIITKEEFLTHGNNFACPGFENSLQKFCSKHGDNFHIMWVYLAALIFNPLSMVYKQVAHLNSLINGLQGFQFPEFSPYFLES